MSVFAHTGGPHALVHKGNTHSDVMALYSLNSNMCHTHWHLFQVLSVQKTTPRDPRTTHFGYLRLSNLGEGTFGTILLHGLSRMQGTQVTKRSQLCC